MHRADRSNFFKSIGQALNRSGHPVLEEAVNRYKALSPLKNAWQRAVAQPLCHHAEPVSLRNGVLTVRAESPVWANMLRNSEQSTVVALREAGLIDLKSLRIRMSPPEADSPAPPVEEQLDSEDNRKFRRLFAQLRKALD